MREIGTIAEERDALLFRDHLTAQNISSKVVQGKQGWAVWVHNEDQVPQASTELSEFITATDRSKYLPARETAKVVAKTAAAKDAEYRKKVQDLGDRWHGPQWKRFPFTFLIVLACFVVAAMTDIGTRNISRFLYSTYSAKLHLDPEEPAIVTYRHGFGDITKGEVWRLITPIFLHFGVAHLVCNMLALRVFGAAIEYNKGWKKLLLLVVISGVISNTAQFLAELQGETVHPFGGMSGVCYALFGYLWTKGNWRPEERLGVNPNTVFLMMAWFFFCMTGNLGPIANTAHGAGLIVGMTLGLTRF